MAGRRRLPDKDRKSAVFCLRIKDDLAKIIRESAEKNFRTVSQEISFRLQRDIKAQNDE